MDENTPLLGKGAVSNRHRPLIRSSTTFEGQTSLLENDAFPNLDERHEDLSRSKTFQQEAEVAVPLEEIVEALCSAWQRNRTLKAEITLGFFTTRELYAMHLAWVNVTRGRHCHFEGHIIAEALAVAIATVIFPKFPFPLWHLSFISWNLAFHADKNLLAVNLLREWKRITEGDKSFDAENFTILDDSDHLLLDESEENLGFWKRQTRSYGAIRSFIHQPRFQIPLHTLLIIWPVSIEIIATKFMDCPISYHILYLLMILGGIGCLAIFIRLALILFTKHAEDPDDLFWGWTTLRLIEFSFFIVFIIQAFHFFDTHPPPEEGPDECSRNFYDAALKANWVSIVLVSAYLLLYIKSICLNEFRASH
ncbi:uncharacterized protein LOC129985142 [Argiope bruennichi]|uniref:uncharacterized protein LOC129985142 n=1 Tax=Argiope bruennichi TaxID=94029 RepID=UPI002493F1FF|nr:uncharacterized protein LOC129985142 [Argiope bruennichi]